MGDRLTNMWRMVEISMKKVTILIVQSNNPKTW